MPENNKYTFEDILRYLDGEFSALDAADFERTLEMDTELQEKVQEARQLIAGAVRAGEQESDAEIRKFHRQFKESGFIDKLEPKVATSARLRITKLTRNRLIAAAALVLIIIVAGVFLTRPKQGEMLFAEYYSPDSMFVQETIDYLDRSAMATTDKPERDSLKNALQLYRDGNFSQASESLESHIEQYGEDNTALLYLGLSKVEQGEMEEAIEALTPVAESSDGSVNFIARWSLGLAYLRTDRVAKATEMFEEIARDDTSPYQPRAQDLLAKLAQ